MFLFLGHAFSKQVYAGEDLSLNGLLSHLTTSLEHC